MSLSLLFSAASLAAIAATLDLIVKPTTKRRIQREIEAFTLRKGSQADFISAAFNKFFGSNYWSLRSLLASLILSSAFIALSLIVVYCLNASTYETVVDAIVQLCKSSTGLYILFIALLTNFLFDYISYNQTRYFVRGTSSFKGAAPVFVFFPSDIIISSSLFVIGFSITRIFAMLIVLQSVNLPHFEDRFRTSPWLAQATLKATNIDKQTAQIEITRQFSNYVDDTTVYNELTRVLAMLQVDTDISYDKIDYSPMSDVIRKKYSGQVGEFQHLFSTYAEPGCISLNQIPYIGSIETYDITANSLMLLSAINAFVSESDPNTDDVINTIDRHQIIAQKLIEEQGARHPKCSLPYVTFNTQVSTKQLIAKAGVFNIFFASLSRTMGEYLGHIQAKFSNYTNSEVASNIPELISGSWTAKSYSLLDVPTFDYDTYRIAYFIDESETVIEKSYKLPFTTFATSSLGASILYGMFIILFAATRVFELFRTLAGHYLANIEAEKYLFSGLFIGMFFMVVTVWFLSVCISTVWKLTTFLMF